ncbi:MAG: hypothetical protein H0U91_02705 [Rubrobacter sp.]|nr:hypothetical protein [Rubrobacter sp.]
MVLFGIGGAFTPDWALVGTVLWPKALFPQAMTPPVTVPASASRPPSDAITTRHNAISAILVAVLLLIVEDFACLISIFLSLRG